MTKEKAIKIAKENGMERILDVCRFGNFHEVVGKAGGDTITFRIYDSGMVTER